MPEATHERVQRELFLRAFFDAEPPRELAELLSARMRDRRFEPGENLYEQGQAPGALFLVTEGTVELVAPGEEPWVMSGQTFLGGIDAHIGQPHPRTARAKTSLRAVEIHFEEYLGLIEDFFEFAKDTLVQGSSRTHEAALRLAPDGLFAEASAPSGRWLQLERLDEVQRLIVLRKARALERAPVQALVTLGHVAIEERFSAGQTIFRAQEENRGACLVVEGTAVVHHDDPHVNARVGPGEFILGVYSIVPVPYIFSAAAETDLVLLRVAHDDLFDAMEEHFGLARSWWAYMGRENHRVRLELARRTRRSG